jgi:hypothetical protein
MVSARMSGKLRALQTTMTGLLEKAACLLVYFAPVRFMRKQQKE